MLRNVIIFWPIFSYNKLNFLYFWNNKIQTWGDAHKLIT
jgi:hypothetical protein